MMKQNQNNNRARRTTETTYLRYRARPESESHISPVPIAVLPSQGSPRRVRNGAPANKIKSLMSIERNKQQTCYSGIRNKIDKNNGGIIRSEKENDPNRMISMEGERRANDDIAHESDNM